MSVIQIGSGIVCVIASSVMWRMGGADGFSKNWRRIGVPIITLVYGLIMGLYWQAPLIAFFIWLISILPITLIGSEVIPKNIAWIICLGTFYGATISISFFPSAFYMLLGAGVYTLVYSTLVLGSEAYRLSTGKDIWWIQEYLSGGILAALIVGGSYLG